MTKIFSTDECMPLVGIPVRVHGDYIAQGTGNPIAHLRRCRKGVEWSSNEWRGMVAITHWSLVDKQ